MESITALYGTFWALLPPIIAIALALLTKEVYSSLFVGIVVGGFLYSGGSFVGALNHLPGRYRSCPGGASSAVRYDQCHRGYL